MTKFYVLWYLVAVLCAFLAWRWTATLKARWLKLFIRTGALTVGFTTVPLGGTWYPVGVFYWSSSSQQQAALVATQILGAMWVALFVGSLLIGTVLRRRKPAAATPAPQPGPQ